MKRVYLYFIILIALLPSGKRLIAQEWLGIAGSNFAGNTGLNINPATVVGAPFNKEFHLFSMGLSVHNNYVYLPRYSKSIFKLTKGDIKKQSVSDRYTQSPDKQAYYKLDVRGPGKMRSSENSGFAWNLAYRHAMSARDVDYHIAKFMLEGFNYYPQHKINFTTDPYKLNFMSFYEIGITSGRSLIQSDLHYLTTGVTGSLDIGNAAFFADGKNMDYYLPNSEELNVSNVNLDYGYAFGGQRITPFDLLRPRGIGGHFNIGLNYMNGRNPSAYNGKAKAKLYNYRVGVSLIDVGTIQYMNQTKYFSYTNRNTVWLGIDTTDFKNLAYNDSMLGVKFTGAPDGAYITDNFRMYHPAAFSIQADYAVTRHIYVGATWVQHINLFAHQVQRSDIIAITPRYETRKFEIALPYSFYNYYQHRLGLAFRYKWFFAGSDRLGAFTGLYNLDGIDIYFGFKFFASTKKKNTKFKPSDCYNRF
ncbi:MAG: hypothetical protein IPO27_01930 [Bacteroidetes bacterium]|nr:hypothetical protein [Bacteroidota bacterium]